MLAPRLCRKCSASSRETCPERSEGRALLAEKGVRGKGQQPLSPPQHTLARSANSAPRLIGACIEQPVVNFLRTSNS